MVALTRSVVFATSLLVVSGCWSQPETRGVDEALAIYRRGARAGESLEGHRWAPAPEARSAAADMSDRPLTVDGAIELAKRNSVRLAELSRRVAAADAAVEAAGQRSNPDIRVTNVRLARTIDRGEDPRATPRLRFTPERPGEIAAREAEARAAGRSARAEMRAEELAIEAEVRWYFDDIVLLDVEIAAAERMAEARRKIAEQTRDQLATATTTAVDVSLADLHMVDAAAHVAERRSRRALLVEALLDRIGRPPGARLELEGNPSAWPPAPLPSEQVLVETALERSSRVADAAARIDGASARLHREQTQRWPWFRFVEVGYEFERSSTNVPLWTVGAGVELPIFSANGGAIRQAEASKGAAKKQLEAEVDRIVRDVRARLREANSAAALVTEYRKIALPALEQASNATDRALESGGIGTLRALTIEERRRHIEIELFRLVRQYRMAVDALRRAVGGPLVASVSSASDGGGRGGQQPVQR